MFQSTLPRRERQKTEKLSGQTQCFNPRSREGSDKKLQPCPLMFHVFQSTLPRRERPQFQPKIHSNFQQKSTNYHFIYLVFPFSHSLFSIIHFICAHFRVRIPRHFHVRFLFALLYYHKINVSSTAIPRSTPICSTFV